MSEFYDDANRFSDFRQDYLHVRFPKQILMDDDPKTLSMFNSLFGTIINTDSVNTRIDLLLKKDEI